MPETEPMAVADTPSQETETLIPQEQTTAAGTAVRQAALALCSLGKERDPACSPHRVPGTKPMAATDTPSQGTSTHQKQSQGLPGFG